MAASSAATSSSMIMSRLCTALFSPSMKWAVSGWALFLTENIVLSEHRTYLIDALGSDDRYHQVYGLCSTLATGSIVYSYYVLSKTKGIPISSSPLLMIPYQRQILAWISMTLGLGMASQAIPKLQMPIQMSSSSSGLSLQVQCPFDFTNRTTTTTTTDSTITGLDRISRHAGLWSLAFMGAGVAMVQANHPVLAKQVWWMGPTAVAWMGGWHTDSRYRRNIGGTLDPQYDAMTSNVPFLAMMTGRQGSQAWTELGQDIKPGNAIVAAVLSTVWVASRGRVRVKTYT